MPKDAWRIWKKSSGTKEIQRIGARYINRIDIPSQHNIQINDYLTASLIFPRKTLISEYLIRFTQRVSDHWEVTITSALVPPHLIGHTSLVLDIDVFRTKDIHVNDDAVLRVIDESRGIKNAIFNECLTEKTKELCGTCTQ